MIINNKLPFDNIGIFVSASCVVHCIFLPIALLIFPTVKNPLLRDNIFHPIFMTMVIFIGIFAFCKGYCLHKKQWVLWLAIAGAGALIPSVLNAVFTSMPEMEERIITIFGGILIISAHFINLKLSGQYNCTHQ